METRPAPLERLSGSDGMAEFRVSSPRDVGSERALAIRVLERLQLEFCGRVELAPVFWEHQVLKATDTFQSQIPRAGEADLCVFILWSWFDLRRS